MQSPCETPSSTQIDTLSKTAVQANVDMESAPTSTQYVLEFDGQDDYVELPRVPNETAFTVEVICTPRRHGHSQVVSSKGFYLSMHPEQTAWCLVGRTSGNRFVDITCPQEMVIGQRVTLAGSYDGQKLQLFVNGKLIGEQLCNKPQMPGRIGSVTGAPGQFFAGTVEAVRISRGSRYDGDYSIAEPWRPDEETLVLYRFEEGHGTILKDSTGSGRNAKIIGAKWIRTDARQAPPRAVAPFDAEQAKAHQQAWADYLGVSVEKEVELPGGETMTFVLIPAGEFMMGSSQDEIDTSIAHLEKVSPSSEAFNWIRDLTLSEGPRHQVVIRNPFWLAKYEVTRGQFRQFVNAAGYRTDAEKSSGGVGLKDGRVQAAAEFIWSVNPGFEDSPTDKHPVSNVSWNDASAFCQWVSQRESTLVRLPTEAEWEFACRAGTTTRWSFGDDETLYGEFAWSRNRRTDDVGRRKPNAFGLYDMHGNVSERCFDWYGPYSSTQAIDPSGSSQGEKRVHRGAAFVSSPQDGRSARRLAEPPNYSHMFTGFRVAIPIDELNLRRSSGKASNSPKPAISPFDADQAKAHQQTWADYLGVPVVTTNSIGMKLAVIPPGQFKMGEENGQVDVTLTKPFRLGVHEVTQKEWQAVMETSPWRGKLDVIESDKVPATFVSWGDAVAFCRRLTERDRAAGKLPDGWEYRLPTEAEWEWACRAGTATAYSFGDEALLGEHAWFELNAKNAGEAYAHAVGLKKPNPWGLHDIHGNVWEWCSDWREWHENALAGGESPAGPREGTHRVIRGGNWYGTAGNCRSAARGRDIASSQRNNLGFRLALSPVDNLPGDQIDSSPPKPAGDAPRSAIAPFDAAAAKAHQQAWADYLGEPVETTNSIGMKLTVIPPGTFKMGAGRNGAGGNIVDVTLTKPFRIGIHEVTQAQWKSVMNTEPWKEQQGAHEGETVAATNISWHAASAFCQKLTEQERSTGRLSDNWQYRLPTEAQWEFACRAGTTTPFSFGDDPSQLGNYGWYLDNAKNAGADHPHPVGQKKPNAWGLFDVHGNVWECCFDFFYGNYAGGTDPMGPSKGDRRAKRGGAWLTNTGYCWSATRLGLPPSLQDFSVGFRVALIPASNELFQSVGSSTPKPHQENTNPPAVAQFNASSERSPFEILTSPDWIWSAPLPLRESAEPEALENGPAISGDGSTLLFTRLEENGRPEGNELLMATRTSSGEWSSPQPLPGKIGDVPGLCDPHWNAETESLYLHTSSLPGRVGASDLFISRRDPEASTWSVPEPLGRTVNSSSHDQAPTLSADGLILVFNSDRDGGHGDMDLWISTRQSIEDDWSSPLNAGPELNTSHVETHPGLSSDGLVLLFVRSESATQSHRSLWQSVRSDRDSSWQPPVEVRFAEPFRASVRSPELSAHGRTLIFVSRPRDWRKDGLMISHRIPASVE